MRLVALFLSFFLATILVATSHGSSHDLSFQINNPIRMKTSNNKNNDLFCSSWRVGVEAHNIINWTHVPEECEEYVKNYITKGQYREDSKVVIQHAIDYANSLTLSGNGRDIWVFDIDDTTLSHVPYYAEHRYGVEKLDIKAFNEWVELAKAPRLEETYKLYKRLLNLSIDVVFITGRPESQRDITIKNLNSVGFNNTWKELILRDFSVYGWNTSSLEYKVSERKKLVEEENYRIIGNIGDQWSDILGTYTGNRTFKLPNPMVYFA